MCRTPRRWCSISRANAWRPRPESFSDVVRAKAGTPTPCPWALSIARIAIEESVASRHPALGGDQREDARSKPRLKTVMVEQTGPVVGIAAVRRIAPVPDIWIADDRRLPLVGRPSRESGTGIDRALIHHIDGRQAPDLDLRRRAGERAM